MEERAVEPDSAVRERGLDADLRGLDLLLAERRDLHGEERPRVDAAALVAGRERAVHHQVVGECVVDRNTVVVAVALERLTEAAEAENRAVRRVRTDYSRPRERRRTEARHDLRAVRIVSLPLIEL